MFIQAFFEGIIAALGALVLELGPAIFGLVFSKDSLPFIFFAVSVEEILKYAFIYNHYLKAKFQEKIIWSAFFIGLGFALAELFLKQLDYRNASPFLVLGVILVHLFTASASGFFLTRKYNRQKCAILLLISLNIALHFGYNFLILRYF